MKMEGAILVGPRTFLSPTCQLGFILHLFHHIPDRGNSVLSKLVYLLILRPSHFLLTIHGWSDSDSSSPFAASDRVKVTLDSN